MNNNNRRKFIKTALAASGCVLISGNSGFALPTIPETKVEGHDVIHLPSRKENPNISRGIQLGNYKLMPSNTGKDWKVTGETVYNMVVDPRTPAILLLGIDTEGGDRAKTNLLRKPIELVMELADNSVVYSSEVECDAKIEGTTVEYSFSPYQSKFNFRWKTEVVSEQIFMEFDVESNVGLMTNHDKETKSPTIRSIKLIIPFDPKAMGTNILSEHWGEKGQVQSPLIINALDMGQLVLNNANDLQKKLNCEFLGSRATKRTDFYIDIVGEDEKLLTGKIVFTPVHLEKPSAQIPDDEWLKVRRGLLSLLQCTPYYPQANGFCGSPGGIIGNNVISDPVSCYMRHNLRWVAGMGDKAIVSGVNLNNIVKYTIEYWLNNRMNDNNSIDYVLEKGNITSDSNTGVLNSAGDYFNSTHDTDFVKRNFEQIKKAVGYFEARDLFNDGLFISFRDGDGGRKFGDTAYDTVSSGYKNALTNAQAYKAYLDVAYMMREIDQTELERHYIQRAVKLRKAFNEQFYDANTGLYYWWIGKNGIKHQYIMPILIETAVTNGIADCLKQDVGVDWSGKDMLNRLWEEFDSAQYYDSAKKKQVKYIDTKSNNYEGFYWGIPTNLKSIPVEYNYSTYGEFEFPYYCNGGIFPQDTTFAIEAYNRVGMKDKADIIKMSIYKRQHEGIFDNGSGFYMGVINIAGLCYSIIKWDGTPTDYEGILSRDCSFLESTVMLDNEVRSRIYGPIDEGMKY